MERFNKQGRTISDSMRARAFAKMFPPKPSKASREEHRGFAITRGMNGGAYYIGENGRLWPMSFTTTAKAREAVDRCLSIRAEVAASEAIS
jgi:hypothetical protein